MRDNLGHIIAINTTKNGESIALVTQATYQPFGPLQSIAFGNAPGPMDILGEHGGSPLRKIWLIS